MKIYRMLTGIALLCVTGGADATTTVAGPVGATVESKSTNQDFLNRRPFSLTVNPLGMTTLAANGRGAGFGYVVANRRQLIANYLQGEIDSYRQNNSVAFHTTGNVRFAELSLRSFVTESFYADFGLAYRQLVVDLTAYDNDQWIKSNIISHSSRYLGALFSVGNQWYWDHVTIGVAWIGGYLPVQRLSMSQKEHTTPKWAVGSKSEEQRKQVSETSKSLDLRAFTVNLGMLF